MNHLENKQNLIPEKKTNILIEELNLSVRAYNCLKAANKFARRFNAIFTKRFRKIKSFGQKSMLKL